MDRLAQGVRMSAKIHASSEEKVAEVKMKEGSAACWTHATTTIPV